MHKSISGGAVVEHVRIALFGTTSVKVELLKAIVRGIEVDVVSHDGRASHVTIYAVVADFELSDEFESLECPIFALQHNVFECLLSGLPTNLFIVKVLGKINLEVMDLLELVLVRETGVLDFKTCGLFSILTFLSVK